MAWGQIANIMGPQGPQGNQGDQGVQGEQGIQGVQGVRGTMWFSGAGAPGVIPGSAVGDIYLNTTNGDLYQLS